MKIIKRITSKKEKGIEAMDAKFIDYENTETERLITNMHIVECSICGTIAEVCNSAKIEDIKCTECYQPLA